LDSLGTCAYVGTAQPDVLGSILMLEAMTKGLTVRGVLQGDSTPGRMIPRLLSLHQRGLFPFDRLQTTYRLDEVNKAANDCLRGDVVKPVILMNSDVT